ncbi:hypothetical protein SUDANB140_07498 [Streptomyces sp. enrichment culture]
MLGGLDDDRLLQVSFRRRCGLPPNEGSTMRKIIICTFLTLDGVMQAPGGPDEDTESGFRHGGWQKPVDDDELGTVIAGWSRRTGRPPIPATRSRTG